MAQITSGSLTIVDVTDGAPGLNNTTVFLYRRATSAPDKPTGDLTYTFATASVSGDLEGWAQSISELSGSNPIWMIAAVASSNGGTDIIEPGDWAGPIKMAQDGQDGQPGTNGLNQATVFIYKRDDSATAPSSTTYTFATGGFTVPSGWSKTIPTEPKGKPCWVTSAIAIGAEATAQLNWVAPSVLVEDGSDGVSPTVTATGNGVKIVDADGNETFITNGANGTSYYTFVRYSKNADGSNYVDTPTAETIYIGVYTGTESVPPVYSDSGWKWSKYVGADGQPGTPGSQGPQGVSVMGTRELYYLKTNSTDPAQITDANQIYTTDDVNQWTSVVPTYTGSGKYYTCIETTLSNGNVVWSAPVENKGLTDANVNAANAIEIARGVKQHFFWVATDKSENIPAGAYVAEESEESFYSNPTKGNILTRSDGIWIRNGIDTLAALQGSGLTFLVPTGTYKGQRSVSLNGSGLTFYNIGSSNTAAATLASDGLQIENGSIILGGHGTSGVNAGDIALSNKNFTRSINETPHSNLRFAIGSKFGVASDGTLYAAGADIIGQVRVTAGSNVYTTDDVNPLEIGGRNLFKAFDTLLTADKKINDGTSYTYDATTGTYVIKQTTASPSSFVQIYTENAVSDISVIQGKQVTLSVKGISTSRGAAVPRVYFYAIKSDGTSFSEPLSYSNRVNTFTVPSDIVRAGYIIRLDQERAGELNETTTFTGIKLELGNKATDWSPAPEDVQAEIETKKSVHTLTTNYSYSYAQILTYSRENDTSHGVWAVTSASGVKIGDTVRLKVTVSDMNNAPVYIIGTVTAVSENNVTMNSHGVDTTIIDGGNILTNSIGANQIVANSIGANQIDAESINASKSLTVGAMTDDTRSEILSTNMLLDWNAPSLTKVNATTGRYWSSVDSKFTASWGSITNPPETNILYGARITLNTSQTSAASAAIAFYSDTSNVDLPMQAGVTYTISCWARVTSGSGNARIAYRNSGASAYVTPATILTSTWKRVSITATPTAIDYGRIWFYANFAAGTTGTVEMCGFKCVPYGEATNYITQIDDAGIFISPANQSPTADSTGNSVKIDGTGMYIYKGGVEQAYFIGTSIGLGQNDSNQIIINGGGLHVFNIVDSNRKEVALFGNTARIGRTDGPAFYVQADKLQAYYMNGSTRTKYFEVSPSGISFGNTTNIAPDDILNSKVQIGGTNLLENTKLRKTGSSNGITFTETNAGPEYIYISGTATAAVDQWIANLQDINITDVTVTISANYIFSSSIGAYFSVSTTKSDDTVIDHTDNPITYYSSTERRLTITLENGEKLRFLRLHVPSGATLGGSYRFKVEVGNKQTTWTPAEGTYITNIGNDGISVHPGNGGNNYLTIDSDGMNIYKGGVSVAEYGGDSARIGIDSNSRFLINSNSLQAYNSSNDKYFEVSANGISFGNTTTDDILNSKVQVGGTNLLNNTKLRGANNDSYNGNGISITTSTSGPEYVNISGTATAVVDQWVANLTNITITNTTVTISSSAVPSASGAYFYISTTKNGSAVNHTDNPIKWYSTTERRMTITLADGETLRYLRLYMPSGGTIDGNFRFKVEVGNKQTTWTPAEDTYITNIGNDGIRIHPGNGGNNYITINSDSMQIYKDGISVAEYGDEARVGASNSSHIEVEANALRGISNNGTDFFEIGGYGGSYTKDTYVTVSSDTYATSDKYSAKTINLTTAMGSGWTNLASGSEFNILISWYAKHSVGTIKFYSVKVVCNKGTANSSNSYVTYNGADTITISAHCPTLTNPIGTGTLSYPVRRDAKIGIKKTIQASFYRFGENVAQTGGPNSFVIGEGTQATHANQLSIGQYNTDVAARFVIGSGTDDAHRGDAFYVTATGQVNTAGSYNCGGYKLITTDTVTKAGSSISGSGYDTISISASKTGYTPIGIIGYEITGTNSQNIVPYRMFFNGTSAEARVRNVGSSSVTPSVTFHILYVASGQGI